MNPYSLAGVFLISGLNLLLEVLLIRILSISQGYHYAFLVVSLALLGIGASGSILSLLKSRLQKIYPQLLVVLPLLHALSLLFNYWVLSHYFIDRYELSLHLTPWLKLGLFILSLASPFFFSGLLLGIIYTFRGAQVGAYYGCDLIGAAIGSLIFLPLGYCLPPHLLYSFIIIFSLFASLLFAFEIGLKRAPLRIGIVSILCFLFVIIFPLPTFQASPYKSLSLALRYPGSQNLKILWNPYSQVNLLESPAVRYAPGLSLLYEEKLPQQKGVTVDGNSLNGITKWNGKEKKNLDFISYLPSSVAYRVGQPRHVLVVNTGGGLSILEAIYWGAESIDVIEPNPLVVRAVADAFEFSPYDHPSVSLYQEDPRHFLSRTRKLYDRIVISSSKNPSPTSTGLYGLSENYLFTLEALESMKGHLADDGYLSMTRYYLYPPREEPRLTQMFKKMKGDLKNHLTWIESWGTSTLLLKKTPFTSKERHNVRTFSQRYGFREVTDKYLKLDSENYLFDLSVPTDNNPFFFQFVRLSRIPELLRVLEGRWDVLIEGGLIVWIILGFSILFCIVFILLPLVFRGEKDRVGNTGKGMLVYFLLLGLGFMFVEMALIHRCILLFSHPSYAVSISLFVILLSSGMGSFYFYHRKPNQKFPFVVFGALVFLSLLFFIFLPFFIRWLLPLTGVARFIILFVLFFPIGFFMGIPFSYGVKSLSTSNQGLIPWAWGINATFSVIGSILSVILAVQWGYSVLFLLSAFCYGSCFIFLPRLSRQVVQTGPP